MALLETRGLNKHFGGLHVTADVNFAVEPGEIHCLIGPNGAGKSTFFRLILGEHRPSSGQIYFAGEDITGLKPFERIRRGISVKFQVPGIFNSLSVRQNLEIALQHQVRPQDMAQETDKILAFPTSLIDNKGQPAASDSAKIRHRDIWDLAWMSTQGAKLDPNLVVAKIGDYGVVDYEDLLAQAIKTIPIGTGYAIWTGIGAVGTAILGIFLFAESAALPRLACIALIIAGIIGLKLTSA